MAKQEKIVRERIKTPEKEADLYLKTLESKRDVLSSHYALNSLRKSINERIDEIPDNKFQEDEEVKRYEAVKKEYDRRREKFLGKIDELSEEDQQKLSELTNLTGVEVALSTIEGRSETEKKSEASERFAQVVTERSERDATTPEVDAMIEHAKRTGRLLELAYWEEKKKELQERDEAESNPDKTPPKGFGQRVKAALDDTLNTWIEVDPRMWPLYGVPDWAKKKPAGPETKSETAEAAPEKETKIKKSNFWSWLKERGRGVRTPFAWREFHQAEIIRSKTKEVENDVRALAQNIQHEINLEPEEAEATAWEIVDELKNKNLDISAPEFFEASRDVFERKAKENADEENYIIKSAWEDLREKAKKYRGEEGQDVFTEETKKRFESELRRELHKVRDGAVKEDVVKFAGIMRKGLDPDWWYRYVWGAAESTLWFAGITQLVMKYEIAQAAKLAAAEKAAGVGKAGTGAAEFLTEKMHESVWHTLDQMAQNGPGHFRATPQQLEEWSKTVLNTNHWYEPEWVKGIVQGLRSSRMLPEGLPIKIPLEVMKAMGY